MRKKYIILLIILFQSIVYCNSNKLINLGLHSMKKDELAILRYMKIQKIRMVLNI